MPAAGSAVEHAPAHHEIAAPGRLLPGPLRAGGRRASSPPGSASGRRGRSPRRRGAPGWPARRCGRRSPAPSMLPPETPGAPRPRRPLPRSPRERPRRSRTVQPERARAGAWPRRPWRHRSSPPASRPVPAVIARQGRPQGPPLRAARRRSPRRPTRPSPRAARRRSPPRPTRPPLARRRQSPGPGGRLAARRPPGRRRRRRAVRSLSWRGRRSPRRQDCGRCRRSRRREAPRAAPRGGGPPDGIPFPLPRSQTTSTVGGASPGRPRDRAPPALSPHPRQGAAGPRERTHGRGPIGAGGRRSWRSRCCRSGQAPRPATGGGLFADACTCRSRRRWSPVRGR